VRQETSHGRKVHGLIQVCSHNSNHERESRLGANPKELLSPQPAGRVERSDTHQFRFLIDGFRRGLNPSCALLRSHIPIKPYCQGGGLDLQSAATRLQASAQPEACDAERKVHARLPLHGERLQRDRSVRPANQYFGPGAQAERGIRARSHIISSERTTVKP
jgi:hypothetical protein